MFKYEEFILEKLLLESIVYYSPNLRKLLNRIDSPISKDLIDIEGDDIKDDISFIDIDETELGKLTFKTAKSMMNKSDEINTQFLDVFNPISVANVYKYYPEIWKASRNPIKIGKLVNTFFPGKYTPGDIEKFTNIFKSSIENSGERMIIVEGEAIGEWYSYSKYWELKSSLGGSCMRAKDTQFFELYNNNPDTVKMLCLIDEDSNGVTKLKGRALVWKISDIKSEEAETPKFEWFLDRQYTFQDAEVIKFKNYANKMGWAYKTYNNHRDYGLVSFNDTLWELDMVTNVKVEKYKQFPYMDTFKRYNPNTGELFNDKIEDRETAGNYILESTSGGYQKIKNPDDYIHSSWLDEDIERASATYSTHVSSWLPEMNIIIVSRGSQEYLGVWPDNHDDIVYCNTHSDHIHYNDAVNSDYSGTFILKSDSIYTIRKFYTDLAILEDYIDKSLSNILLPIEEVKDLDWFKLAQVVNNINEIKYTHILKDSFVLNYKKELIPVSISTDVCKLKNPIGNISFMRHSDAVLLDLEVYNITINLDWCEYSNLILTNPDLMNKISQLKNKDVAKSQLLRKINYFNLERYELWKK